MIHLQVWFVNLLCFVNFLSVPNIYLRYLIFSEEKFQKLKEYYDFLLDPVLKNEYDRKIKAKIAAAKRHSELDDERRRLKESK